MADTPSFGQKLKQTAKRIAIRILIIGAIISIGIFSFLYWAVYERGVMAGKVLRVSEKGILFKTIEGKLNLETFGALKGASPIAESFDFSVEKSQNDVIQELQQVALSGERVNLFFVKRYAIFWWRGEHATLLPKWSVSKNSLSHSTRITGWPLRRSLPKGFRSNPFSFAKLSNSTALSASTDISNPPLV